MKRSALDQLDEVLRLHKRWLNGEDDGTRAGLTGRDLQGADLRGADLRGAVLTGADLRRADLRGADLKGAVLTGADLTGADLTGAVLSGAVLTGADLTGADLTGAVLRGADLRGAVLTGADLRVWIFRVFSGLYEYQCWAIVALDGTPWVRMGCLWKPVAEWDAAGIRNSNPDGYPDDGSPESERRVRAFEFARTEALILAGQVKK